MSSWNRTLPLPNQPQEAPPKPPADQAAQADNPGTPSVPPAVAPATAAPIGSRDPGSIPVGFHDPGSIPVGFHDPGSIPAGFRDPGSIPVGYQNSPPPPPAPPVHPGVTAPPGRRGMPTIPSASGSPLSPPGATAEPRADARLPAGAPPWAPGAPSTVGSCTPGALPPLPAGSMPLAAQLPPAAVSWPQAPAGWAPPSALATSQAVTPPPAAAQPPRAPTPSAASAAPQPAGRRAPARTVMHLGTTATTGASDVREASPAVRTASEPEPLPPGAPRWMHEGRALARLIETAIASGDASPYLRLGIERAAWALQPGGQPAAQVARLCRLIDRVHRVLRSARPEDIGALVGDCAVLMRSSLATTQLKGQTQAELLELTEQLAREPYLQRARRLGARRLLGWEELPEAWIDTAIEAALDER